MPDQYEYSDYMAQETRAARLARARLHHAELSDLIASEASGDGRSESTQTIETALARVEKFIRENDTETAVGRTFRMRRSRR